MSKKEIRVPDLGDFKDVPIIEVHVKVGASVAPEDPLITLESDKASFDVPAPEAGKIVDLLVKVGDKVSEGSVILTLESGAATAPSQPEAPKKTEVAPVASAAKDYSGDADHNCEVLVLGAGPGGYSAAFRAADLGAKTILVDRWPTLGGVCLNVGCIPSKALLHTAFVVDEAAALAKHGISFGAPKVDLQKLAAFKDGVVGKLTGGLASMAKARKVTTLRGTGTFAGAHHLKVRFDDGHEEAVRFEKAIIAAGSEAVALPFMPSDPRIVDSTGALELRQVPDKMLVIGGGIIGLEMATVYSTLGARLDVVELLDGLMPGADRDLVSTWQKVNARRFDKVMLKTKVVAAEAKRDGIYVTFEGENAPPEPRRYGLVLVAVGRKPNGKMIAADNAGVAVSERGFIPVDKDMRTNVPHIFAIGDIADEPMLAHKAVHQGHVAAENAAGKKSFFDVRQVPSVAYTDPEITWAGLTETEAKARGIAYKKAVFPWAASGRAIANGRDEGFTKLLFDEKTERIMGGAIVGTEAGNLISEICLAIEMGADAVDIGKTIHPHPTLSESVGMAAEVAEGVCTDLMPAKSPRPKS
ncbi:MULTISPECIES: dihydrolipoyl dehydrogenase [unclassified Hyphomicrobium]|uniref:dihydrolipoyl dehydrogenase n=1 Tax=unclassified Hyphomicrobium TaxID=2619925 RepID=UPI000213D7E8|nr:MULTISPECIES: dihydrolipoyl dehydrogenase [unclassified Hyphomicrobium]CCB63772.1 Dihydrolipoyl dehydrogenase (E3 component of pyruvate and 2-oxoglutarate dehydrogenases complexes) (Dihydrolipoamide dehydrogenase) (Glycine cleavage system L protein) [Hyphomicrobium sp. MC1]